MGPYRARSAAAVSADDQRLSALTISSQHVSISRSSDRPAAVDRALNADGPGGAQFRSSCRGSTDLATGTPCSGRTWSYLHQVVPVCC